MRAAGAPAGPREGTPSDAIGHRERATTDLRSTLAVTAGAGSGKTTVLVDRFVNIAREPGHGPDRILAITFTRKAAAEMKARVIREFDQQGDTDRRRRTEGAYISTIHGFAERVLREQPFEARVDPAFQVLTEYEQRRFVQEALQQMYARQELRMHAPRLGRLFRGGWTVFALVQEVARALRETGEGTHAEAALIHDPEACIAAAVERAIAYRQDCERRLLEVLAAIAPLIRGATWKSRKATFEAGMKFAELAERCATSGELVVAPDEWPATGFTGQIHEDDRQPVRELLDRFKPLVGEVHGIVREEQEAFERELLPVKQAIYAAAREVNAAYEAHKRATGLLDFHDLQLRALDLFRSSERVRRAYADRFRHILLDEAQDTDHLQFALIESLRTADNVLFVVGDPKQAIYEFRGANPDVFHGVVARLPDGGRLQLVENFRSRAEVVRILNRVVGPLLPEHFREIDGRADYGGEALDAPVVTTILAHRELGGHAAGGEKEPLSDARHREAAAVAEEVAGLLRAQPKVRDPYARELAWVPLAPRHVAVLFRTRTVVPYFERAFAERGIPYVTAAGAGFYDRAEVLDCLMLLRAVAQPFDDLAMAALLRSPFVGVDDATLWTLRVASGPRGSLYAAIRRHEPLAGFAAAFDALRRQGRGASAWAVLERAIATWNYEAAIAAHQDGVAMLANLAKVRRQVRDLGAVDAGTAYEELQRTRELLDREALAPLVGANDDVVTFTTIHQAKGLEWPVVCLPNLQAKGRGDLPKFAPRAGLLMLEALDAAGEKQKPVSWKACAEEIRMRAEAEERRLMYVALTRARERLVLSASVVARELEVPKKTGVTSPLGLLLQATDGAIGSAGIRAWDGHRLEVRLAPDEVPCTPVESGAPLGATVQPRVVERIPAEPPPFVALPQSVKVTELLSYDRCPQVYRFLHVLEIEENLPQRAAVRGAPGSLSAVELGTRVHRMLERADFHAPDIEAEVQRLLGAEAGPARRRMRDMLAAVLGDDLGEQVRRAARVEREWPFAVELGGVLVEGVIDLALQRADGGWTIVDYKSNDLTRAGRFEYLVAHYRPQLELYAAALGRAGLGPVDACALVFLSGNRVHRWALDPARDVVASATATIEKIARKDFHTIAGSKCEACGYRKRKVCAIGRQWAPVPLRSS
ncbi:MAG: UvrD-helicase domain-containing protein [Gemmatimonadaceae bacterium]